VGKTATDIGTVGHQFLSDGQGDYAAHTSDGTRALLLNRKTSDGEIIDFRKNGTTVGSIGHAGGLYITGPACGLRFHTDGTKIFPTTTTGGGADGTVDLGASSARFKDLYLSGGVYLGGTGAANKLDDYEEGTWTPTLGNGATATNMTGTYTKVGSLVTVTFSLNNSTITGTPDYVITGLPFANGIKRASFPVAYNKTFNITCESIAGLIPASLSQMEFLGMIKGAGWIVANPTAGSGRYLHVTASYQTA